MRNNELNIDCNARIKGWIEYNNIKLVSILCILILVLSVISICFTECAIIASCLSVIIIFIQLCRKDSYSVEFLKNNWEKEDSEMVLKINLGDGFQKSPFVVFKKNEDSYERVIVGEEYISKGKTIKLTINSEELTFDGIVIIGGPLRSGWKKNQT